MATHSLTYLVNTFTKLPFLRCSMQRLLANVQPGEEVVVVDGNSTDGTKEYLQDLASRGAITTYISEPDHGEAEGWNRGLLAGRGDLIKLISDDDIFYYPGIRACLDIMVTHKELDLLWTNGSGMNIADGRIHAPDEVDDFLRWRQGKGLLFCCGLGLMIRRSSLPLVGLFNTSARRIDGEFSLRVSSGPARVGWYSGVVYTRLLTSASAAYKLHRRMVDEEIAFKTCYYFLKRHPPELAGVRSGASAWLRSLIRGSRKLGASAPIEPVDIEAAFAKASKWIEEVNLAREARLCF